MYQTLIIDNEDLGNVQDVLLASDRSANKSDFIAFAGVKGCICIMVWRFALLILSQFS